MARGVDSCLVLFLVVVLVVLSPSHARRHASSSVVGLGHQYSQERPRLYIISVTGLSNVDRAVQMQHTCAQHMSPSDKYFNVCDQGCSKASNDALGHVLTMEDSAFPSGQCRHDNATCDGYRRAQLKFAFGLTEEVRRLSAANSSMPRWWLIKDDDTYVDADRLIASVNDFDPTQDLVSFAHSFSLSSRNLENLGEMTPANAYWPHGGAGWLLSNAFAEKLVLEHGNQWIQLQADRIEHSKYEFYYDMLIPTIVSWIPGAKLLYNEKMLGDYSTCVNGNGDSRCFAIRTGNANGSRCLRPAATMHLKEAITNVGLDKAIEYARECMAG